MRATIALTLIAAPLGSVAPATGDQMLAALQQQLFPTVTAILNSRTSSRITALLRQRADRYTQCRDEISCKIAAARWSETDIARLATVGDAAAIRRELTGLNRVIAVYAEGVSPVYPLIDGPALGNRQQAIATAFASADAIRNEAGFITDPGTAVALALLDGADRLDAVRFGTLAKSENAGALDRAASIDWSRFSYSAIIVPGIGPDDRSTPLSAAGKLNVHLAATRYRAGLAPFVIVSGGSVHPRGTRFVEAIEMRRALIDRYGLPADSILIDPYARHTTTNLRNAGRLLAAMRAPAIPALVVTNPDQASYIASKVFTDRNQTELGYQPAAIGSRRSNNDIEVRFSGHSLPVDPNDPLDP